MKATSISVSFMFYINLDLFAFAMLSLLFILYKSFELTNTLVELYLAPYRLMSLTKAVILIALALLIYPRQECQILIL